MYRCEWCGAEFEEPIFVVEEKSVYYGDMGRELCPECGEDQFEELEDNDER